MLIRTFLTLAELSSPEPESDVESLKNLSGSDAEEELENDEFDLSEDGSADSSEGEQDEEEDVDAPEQKKRKTDSEAFSKAMTAILGSRIKLHDRKDPILVRSKKTAKELEASRLEAKAKRAIIAEKKSQIDKERIKTLYTPGDTENLHKLLEHEKKLKKTAQRGVIKLFNAIQASQRAAATTDETVTKSIQQEKGMLILVDMVSLSLLTLVRSSHRNVTGKVFRPDQIRLIIYESNFIYDLFFFPVLANFAICVVAMSWRMLPMYKIYEVFSPISG